MTTGTESFVGYEPIAKDPGWAFSFGVVVACILVNLVLPFLAYVKLPGEKALQGNDVIPNLNQEQEQGEGQSHQTEQQQQPQLRIPPSTRSLIDSASSVGSDDESVSLGSVLSQVLETGLHHHNHAHARYRRMPKHTIVKRQHPGKTPSIGDTSPPNRGEPKGVLDNTSQMSKSVHSGFHMHSPSRRDSDDGWEEEMPGEDSEESSSLWDQFLEIADWDPLSKRLVSLTIPMTIQGCTEGFFQIVNVAIIGHFLGVMEANVYVVITILVEFSWTIPYGFGESIGTLSPQAKGAENDVLVGRYLQLGMIFYSILSIPSVFLWCFATEAAVLWFGFDEPTADLAQRYVLPFLAVTFLFGIDHCIHEFLDCMGHEKYSTVAQLICASMDTLTIVALVAFGEKDLVVIGIFQAIVNTICALANLAFIFYKGWFDKYWEGLVGTLSIRDGRAVHTMLITAIPLSIAWVLTYGEWEVLTFFVSVMGPAEVAAWGMLGFIWDTFEHITGGLADAAEVCVGFRLGAGQPHTAKIVAYKTIYLGILIAMFSTAGLYVLAEFLPRWLTPDPTLQKMIFDVLPLMGFGQVLLIIGTTCWGVLSAQGRVRLATAVEFMSSWVFAIPLSALFVYTLNYNLIGPVAALIFGYTFGGLTNGWLILRSDWNLQADIVMARNAIDGVTWEENDWEELPPDVQAAASLLGYTKQMWDSGQEPDSCERSWDELREDEKRAARKIGFNKAKWDKDTGEDSSSTSEAGFSDYDWESLPSTAREAARTLGYNMELWQADRPTPVTEKSWKKLSDSEKAAAKMLGYSEEEWNKCEVQSSKLDPLDSSGRLSDCDWDDLPSSARHAAIMLGYNMELWQSDGSTSATKKRWKNLTDKERAAAQALGYSKEQWNSSGDGLDVSTHSHSSMFSDCDWTNLSSNAREAASLLGYNSEVGETIGSAGTATTNQQSIDTQGEEAVPRNLGGAEKMKSLDESVFSPGNAASTGSKSVAKAKAEVVQESDSSRIERSGGLANDDDKASFDIVVQNKSYAGVKWEQLSKEERRAAETLGFSQQSWPTDGTLKLKGLPSRSLNPAEQKAAKTLGLVWIHGKTNLNENSKGSASREQNYMEMSWKELPPKIREAAGILGFTRKLWNTDGSPPSEDKDWHELTEAERAAATVLGYNQQNWDDSSVESED